MATSPERPVRRGGRLLSRSARTEVEACWTAHLAGDDTAAERILALPGLVGLSAPWREALASACELLAGWQDLTGARAEARERLYDAIIEGLEKVATTMASDPEHPRNAPLVGEIEELGGLPAVAFAGTVPVLVERISLDLPDLASAWAPLLAAIEGLTRGPDEDLPLDEETDERAMAEAGSDPPPERPPEAPRAPPVVNNVDVVALSEAIQDTFLSRWRMSLTERADAWERERIAEALGSLAAGLLRKRETVSRLKRLLGVELEYLGLGGTWGQGLWQQRTWAALEEYAALAEANPAIRRLTEMLGRYEAARLQVEVLAAPTVSRPRATSARRTGREEILGVHFSDDISMLTTGELANLADPDLEILFYMKLLDRQLLTYEPAGREQISAHTEKPRERVTTPARQKGPIILCVDTSASMAGEPELVAKTLALAMLRTALRERRPCWAISYSHTADLREQELTRLPEALGDLVQFLGMSFRGGTDPVPALEAAMRRLETTEFERADVLWITDGRFDVPDAFARHVREMRAAKNFRIHTLLVGEAVVPEFVDYVWEWGPGQSFATGGIQLIAGLAETSV